MLPKKNGFDVLRELRKESKIPVLMLTARGEDMERIVGLEIGADDYLPKPFNPRELVARLRAILRRMENVKNAENLSTEKLEIEDLIISLSGRTAKVDGEKLGLTAVEFDLLVALVREAGNVVKKEDLSLDVLERELSPYDRSLDMHISNLRKKLGKYDNDEDRIKTIRSVGYIYTLSI
jgi:two-component system response regulator CpxR